MANFKISKEDQLLVLEMVVKGWETNTSTSDFAAIHCLLESFIHYPKQNSGRN